MSKVEQRLTELGLELPAVPAAAGNYVPFRMHGNTLYLAGAITMVNGALTHTGKVGDGQSVEDGYQAARTCALNAIECTHDARDTRSPARTTLPFGLREGHPAAPGRPDLDWGIVGESVG